MRLTLPSRIPMLYVGSFASLLLVLQLLDRTDLTFSVCSFFFVLVSGVAFNLAGGLTTSSGGYVFFYSTLGLIIGLVWKTVLAEPGGSNLYEPRTTIKVFLAGICGMLMAVFVSRKLTRKRPLLAGLSKSSNLQSTSTGCLVVSVFLYVISFYVQRTNGSLFSALVQINQFSELAVILGVTHQIQKSGGRSSLNFPAIAATALIWINGGLLGFSKQAMFTPNVCWVLAAAAQSYRMKKAQLVGGALFIFFLFHFMVPYAQYGRNQASNTVGGNIGVSLTLLSDLGAVRAHYLEGEKANLAQVKSGYFNSPQGFFDRLQMIGPDDSIIESTERLGQFGLYPIVADFENLVPHAFWSNKPVIRWGNVFAHDTLVPLTEEDVTTGISFTPSGEAYRLAKWPGVLILAPMIWTMTFVWFDTLCGDVRRSPWGLLVLTTWAHVAPEGMLDGCIYLMAYGTFGIVFAALSAAYVLPHVGRIFSGPGGRNVFLKTEVRRLPRRVSSLQSPESTNT